VTQGKFILLLEVFIGAIEEAWREFEPDAEAHGLIQPLLRPDIVFDLAPLLDALVAALRKDGQPGSVDAYRIQKTDDVAAAKAARAGQRAALAEQLRKLFGDDGGEDGVPLIPDLPELQSSGGGWRPSGAAAFATPAIGPAAQPVAGRDAGHAGGPSAVVAHGSAGQGVSGVARRHGPPGGSSGPFPSACPIARSRRTRPERRTQRLIAGWMPLA